MSEAPIMTPEDLSTATVEAFVRVGRSEITDPDQMTDWPRIVLADGRRFSVVPSEAMDHYQGRSGMDYLRDGDVSMADAMIKDPRHGALAAHDLAKGLVFGYGRSTEPTEENDDEPTSL